MSEENNEKRSALLEEVKKFREFLGSIIHRLESEETLEAIRPDLDGMKKMIIEIFGDFTSAQAKELLGRIKNHAVVLQKELEDIYAGAAGSVKSTAKSLPGIVEDFFGELFGSKEKTISQEELMKKFMTTEFLSGYYKTLHDRGWKDEGISESLGAIFSVLASLSKE